MLMELIAAAAAGFLGAGVAMILRKATGGRLPRASVPVAAGLAILGLAVWSEYTWYGRMSASLPDDVVVTTTHETSSPLRPWTYAAPFVTRFATVDRASIRRNDEVPDQLMVDVLLFARHAPPARVPVLVDCAQGRRADIADGMTFDERGAVADADWRALPAGDPLVAAVCPAA